MRFSVGGLPILCTTLHMEDQTRVPSDDILQFSRGLPDCHCGLRACRIPSLHHHLGNLDWSVKLEQTVVP